MRSAVVFWNGERAGILTENDHMQYTFVYDEVWFADESKPAISLTLPKTQKVYESDHLFPFFYNMLSEGANKKLQSRLLKIDEKDHFGLLLATSNNDSIGAVSLGPPSDQIE